MKQYWESDEVSLRAESLLDDSSFLSPLVVAGDAMRDPGTSDTQV
jgi:hypothetical protein